MIKNWCAQLAERELDRDEAPQFYFGTYLQLMRTERMRPAVRLALSSAVQGMNGASMLRSLGISLTSSSPIQLDDSSRTLRPLKNRLQWCYANSSWASLVALTLQASTAATSIVPSCPRSLETVLASEPCTGRMERLLTASRMIVESTSVQDVCLDSLRALVATSPSIPCVANVNPPTVSGHSHMRRLLSDLKGKHNCTVDMVAPLNQSNPTQNFIIDCKEITDPDDRDWIWLLVALSVPVLVACGLSGVMKMKDWHAKRARRAIDRIDEEPKRLAFKLVNKA